MLSRPEQTKPQLPALPYERLLSAKQVGAEFGVTEDAVLAWWHCGLPQDCGEIPARFVIRHGCKDYLFRPEVVAFIRKQQASLDQPKKPADTGQWLTAKVLAAKFGLKCDSVYRWVSDGTIPAGQVRRLGSYFIRIHPEALSSLEKKFELEHAKSRRVTAVASEKTNLPDAMPEGVNS
jgi:predicted DNA-binding transcriptional regulator AlpA